MAVADSPKYFGQKLRALRKARKMSQAALAHELGLAHQSQISALEYRRKAPTVMQVIKLARIFGVTTDYLLLDELITQE